MDNFYEEFWIRSWPFLKIKIAKTEKLFFHRFQNTTQLFGTKSQFGCFWWGAGFACSKLGITRKRLYDFCISFKSTNFEIFFFSGIWKSFKGSTYLSMMILWRFSDDFVKVFWWLVTRHASAWWFSEGFLIIWENFFEGSWIKFRKQYLYLFLHTPFWNLANGALVK